MYKTLSPNFFEFVSTSSCMRVYVHAYTHIYMYKHMYMYTYTHKSNS